MAWSLLSSRLNSLPLLLAGPIVRRAEATNVSIWFVLKQDRDVTLNIYHSNTITVTPSLMEGKQSKGVGIGDHVFVYCVTATPNSDPLSSGLNYFYDIDFGNGDSLSDLITAGLDLTYDGSTRPSFALPPDDINKVRLIHGSCRKAHGQGHDAMEGIHEIILSAVSNGVIDPINRPHQLFLTGDQIYADDVADALLYMIDDAAKVLFNWDEDAFKLSFADSELAPGKRGNKVKLELGFTCGLKTGKSHLLKFREYATMYLFAWSDVLWPTINDLPKFADTYPGEQQSKNRVGAGMGPMGPLPPIVKYKYFDKEVKHLKRFLKTLKNVRKSLANTPTYMIFDDHEITDDWNLNWRWCKRVYSKPLGKITVQNGLLAYALFQSWGNTPAQFQEPSKKHLLNAASKWRGANDPHFLIIKSLLNIPTIKKNASISDFPQLSTATFNWFFKYEATSYCVYVQDSRTWRSFIKQKGRKSDIDFADLISKKGYQSQLPPSFPAKEIILIIAPCPAIGVPFIEQKQKDASTFKERTGDDTEAWSLNLYGYEKLFSNLASKMPVIGNKRKGRLAILSGDVHYGLSARRQIWGNNFIDDNHSGVETNVVCAQLTASSFKNQTDGLTGTTALHYRGYPHSIGGEISSKLPLIETEALPPTEEAFAWLLGNQQIIGTPSGPFVLKLPKGLNVISPLHLSPFFDTVTINPNWSFRIDWILGSSTGTNPRRKANPTKILVPPDPGNRANSLQKYLSMASNHSSYTKAWGSGKEIVGLNNLGEIRFNFTSSNKQINHAIWWRLEQTSGSNPLQLFPLTTYSIPINENGDKNHKNKSITRPTFNGI
ncbi:hypothetical protein [Mariniflexile sp. AS56]|uniref:hypothetical protein n=1 Tax=Mariniflexile sp. AS56 TaxID=3063957 RepID=UPI0026F0F50F|nr:hypothetical protein [Mariniflexile sp. AS56]MDO7174147.1 hypothetical protein [Mariniflexile sp. AS56]